MQGLLRRAAPRRGRRVDAAERLRIRTSKLVKS